MLIKSFNLHMDDFSNCPDTEFINIKKIILLTATCYRPQTPDLDFTLGLSLNSLHTSDLRSHIHAL